MAQSPKTKKPFGIQFLETPTKEELSQVNGGAHHKKPPVFTSMDIIFHPHGKSQTGT